MQITEADIGGARVRRTFSRGEERLLSGRMLTAEEVLAIPTANRRALSEAGFLELYPRPPVQSIGIDTDAEMHIVHLGAGKYDVIIGKKLNDGVLTKEEAEELATRPLK